MPSDPRHTALMNLLQTRYSHSPERAREWAGDILPLIDAEDPLRQPPSDEAVRAFLRAYDGTLGHRGQKAMGGLVAALSVMRGDATGEAVPIDMILHCPSCHHQHIDAPEADWTNPPHKSHLCAKCATIWRPCDLPTNGVATIETREKFDTWETPDRAPGHTDLMATPEPIDAFVDANPPPDAIEDRLAALEARPQFTAEKEALLHGLVAEVMAIATHREFIALSRMFNKAFPRSDRAWPPKDCLLEVMHPERKSPCVVVCERSDCPHAGERA